jgi:hypothetical protein
MLVLILLVPDFVFDSSIFAIPPVTSIHKVAPVHPVSVRGIGQ